MGDGDNPVYKDPHHGQYREMLYSYDQNGNFKKDVGFHNENDRVVLQQAWDLFHDRTETARQRVLAGKTSPIEYYMEKILVTPKDLATMAGIHPWRVKRHLRPGVFIRLSDTVLKKYAEVFDITVDQLKNIDLIK